MSLDPESESHLNDLSEALEAWEADHIAGRRRAIIKWGRSSGNRARLDETRDTRLEVLFGISELDEVVGVQLQLRLERLDRHLCLHPTTPAIATELFKRGAEDAKEECANAWREGFRALLFQKRREWEEFERPFDAWEIGDFERRFDDLAARTVTQAVTTFENAVWRTDWEESDAGQLKAEDQIASDRRARVRAFLGACRREFPDIKFSRMLIWKSARHAASRQFEYWQANSPKATRADDDNFNRVLAMNPRRFVEILKEERVL
jgi:hypothetical protein